MQLYIVDIRSIGNVMLIEPSKDDPNRLVRPISVDTFLQRLKSKPLDAASDLKSTTGAQAVKPEDAAFQVNHVVHVLSCL